MNPRLVFQNRISVILCATVGIGFLGQGMFAQESLFESGSDQQSGPDLQTRANQGDAEAQFRLGVFYAEGDSFTGPDFKQAVRWYRQAADQGHAGAQVNLGLLYIDGLGVPQDYPKAAEWFRQAALQGDPSGQLELGVMYVNGEGVAVDSKEAYAWYSLAVKQGNSQATEYLQDLSSWMSDSDINAARQRAETLAKKIQENRAVASAKPDGAAKAQTGKSDQETNVPTPDKETADAASATQLRLKRHGVFDPGIGVEAFSLLIPADWRAEGGIQWMHDRSNLATTAMRVRNPSGVEQVEFFPITAYTWSEQGIPFFPQGSVYLGNEVQPPPPDAASYVRQFLIPQHRGQLGVRVLTTERLPEIERTVLQKVQEAGVQKTASGERIRIEYQAGDRWIQEDIYAVLVFSRSPMLPGTTFWGPEYLYSFKAEKGRLDAQARLFQTIAASVKIDPKWFSGYLQVRQMWQNNQMQAIQNAGRLSQYISRVNDEITEINRQAYENQQAAQDRAARQFSNYVRGVEDYKNPFDDTETQLPSGYNDVWVSANGEYILSNQAGFDPNAGSTQNWQRMKTVQ